MPGHSDVLGEKHVPAMPGLDRGTDGNLDVSIVVDGSKRYRLAVPQVLSDLMQQ